MLFIRLIRMSKVPDRMSILQLRKGCGAEGQKVLQQIGKKYYEIGAF
jgi:hypothetical protein